MNNTNNEQKPIANLQEKSRQFKEYQTRAKIIEEVIIDQQLLNEDPPWNLNFIADFHQIYDVAFSPVVDIKVEIKGKDMRVRLILPGEKKKAKIFRERLRKSIPFFGTVRVNPPILIPPYEKELSTRMRSQFERILRQRLRSYELHVESDASRFLRNWFAAVEKLEKPQEDLPESTREREREIDEVEEFSGLTAEGFYILSFANAATASKILKYMLTDTTRPHLRMFPKEDKELTKNLEIKSWVKILETYRNKPYSNVIDACAIALVLRLNEHALQEGKKDIYFLLSDAENLWSATNKFPDKESDKRDKRRKGSPMEGSVSSIIKSGMLPEFCRSDGLHILRTSQHFEEFVMAYDEDLGKQIQKLKDRKEQLIKETRFITLQIDEINEKCSKDPSKCPCELEVGCEELIESISEFLDKEEDVTNLKNIISKKQVFRPLLEFMNKYLEDITEDRIPGIKLLKKEYSSFFSKEYDPTVSRKLQTTLDEYERECLFNILSIAEFSSNLAETPIRTIRKRLVRMHGIVYDVAFGDNERIKELIRGVFDRKTAEAKQVDDVGEWFQDIFKIITEQGDDIGSTLLTIIMLYCYEFYDDSSWMAQQWLDQRLEEIKQKNKEVEFRYMLASSKARNEYLSEDSALALERLDKIVEDLVTFQEEYPLDPRIPYVIGKILGRKYFFRKEVGDEALYGSVNHSRKALEILDSLEPEKKEKYEELRIPLKNNILYCTIRMEQPDDRLLKEVETLYNEIAAWTDKSHYIETAACYNYFKAKRAYEEDKEKSAELFREALRKLLKAIVVGKNENINSQELRTWYSQRKEWKKEYEKKYGKKYNGKTINALIKEWSAKIEGQILKDKI